MNFIKILFSAVIATVMISTNFAAEKIEDADQRYRTNWRGQFKTQEGLIFNHLSGTIALIYQSPSASHVMSRASFSFSETSGIDDWRPHCDLNLNVTMTAQEFFEELSKATNIVSIQPKELAKFLREQRK